MALQPIKRLKRELRVKGNVIDIYADTVEINGVIGVWDFFHHNGAAAVVPVTEDGKILMVKQYRNAIDRFTLEIPAGKVDTPQEPRIQCGYRELEEETGFRTEKLEFLIRVDSLVAFCDEQIDIFVAKNLIPSQQHLDPDEQIEVEPWALEDLLEKIYAGQLRDAKTVAALLAYAQKYR